MDSRRSKFIVDCSQQFATHDSDGVVSASMGCFSGDCPHDSSHECVAALEEVYVAMAREISRLRFWNDKLSKMVPFEKGVLQEGQPTPNTHGGDDG